MTLHLHHVEAPPFETWRQGDRIDEHGMYQEDLPEWPALEEVSRWRRWRARLRVWWRRFRHGPQV